VRIEYLPGALRRHHEYGAFVFIHEHALAVDREKGRPFKPCQPCQNRDPGPAGDFLTLILLLIGAFIQQL
jgi:hypothetical protein